MDLNTAQQLSLIQRNLESAQLNIDSATELLNVVIQKIELDDQSLSPTVVKAAAVKKKRGRPVTKKEVTAPVVQKKAVAKKAATKKVDKPVIKTAEPSDDVLDDADLDELVPAPKTAAGVTAAIREYVKHHSDTFTADDLVRWGKEHGYFFSRKQYAANLSWMSNRQGYPVDKSDKVGVFKPAA